MKPNKRNNFCKTNTLAIFIIYLIAISLSVVLISCNENNPAAPTPIDPIFIDSGFFNWEYHELAGTNIGYFYIADTNTVFISGFPNAIMYDNGVYTNIYYNDTDFFDASISGYDKNNVFIGGYTSHNSGNKSKLKKWNGNTLIDIPMPDYPSGLVENIMVVSPSELWIPTSEGYIYHYINNVFTTYNLDSGYRPAYLLKDISGNIRAYSTKYLLNNADDKIINIYILQNNSWLSEYTDTIRKNKELQGLGWHINNTAVRFGKTGFYYYSNNNWIKCFGYSGFFPDIDGGKNISDILFYQTELYNPSPRDLYYYDGKKLYRQTNHIVPYGSETVWWIEYKFGRYYMLYSPSGGFFSNFSIGTPKNK
ncbi:MAG: hypothetical protein PHN88_13855 [Ignavibacteria bacterium]|nr:hypothetical protein [Ignavibacteria bacterium]